MSRKTASTTSAPRGKASFNFDQPAVEELFNTLCDEEDNDIVSMDGIVNLAEMLSIDPVADVRALVMMWKLGANSKPGQISREEFINGFRNLQINDVAGLIKLLPSFDPGFLDRSEFRGMDTFLSHIVCHSAYFFSLLA